MYAAYGVASPFLPAFVSARGLPAGELGAVLAAGTAVRLLASPLAARLGDRAGALRRMLAACLAAAALATLAYLPARDFAAFVAVALLQAAALGPITVLADALALGAAGAPRGGFEYGWIRGTGSAAFILGTLAAGQAIGAFGLGVIVTLQSALLAAAVGASLLVPELRHPPERERQRSGGFAVIRWSAAGIGPGASSLLWSESVAAEVLVFFLVGPRLVARLTPAGAIALAAAAGVLRWSVMALTTDLAALALAQPLHGLTFALLHLACMRLIRELAPAGLEGTAQAVYATIGVGAASALLTLASGALYARVGAQGFWVMAALCAAALPAAWRLR